MLVAREPCALPTSVPQVLSLNLGGIERVVLLLCLENARRACFRMRIVSM
jgi:hypothetical protein